MEIKPNVVYWCKTKEIAEWFLREYNKFNRWARKKLTGIEDWNYQEGTIAYIVFDSEFQFIKMGTVDVEPFYIRAFEELGKHSSTIVTSSVDVQTPYGKRTYNYDTKIELNVGEFITSLDELAKQEYVYIDDKIYNYGWFMSMQFMWLNRAKKRKSIFKAIKKEN